MKKLFMGSYLKNLLLLMVVLIFAFNSVCFAAIGSSKTRVSSPASKSSSSSTTQTAPASGYKPSAPASSYSDKAPASVATSQQTSNKSTSGGFLRNAAMFGGGMLLGGMLGSMFGFGHGSMGASIIGLLFNVIILVGIFMLGRYLWMSYKARQDKKY
ncbi:MAG: hypothetical protein H6Q73_3928 [Firmicutes bacterium]|nr:hypothetical protein [Bacillota bacterium]